MNSNGKNLVHCIFAHCVVSANTEEGEIDSLTLRKKKPNVVLRLYEVHFLRPEGESTRTCAASV